MPTQSTLQAVNLGQYNDSGFEVKSTALDASCNNKAFYVAGISVTKRKTGIVGSGEKILKGMATPCTGNPNTVFELTIKGQNRYWPELFNKRFFLPSLSTSAGTNKSPYFDSVLTSDTTNAAFNFLSNSFKFYLPFDCYCIYIHPNRNFAFRFLSPTISIPKEFFSATYIDNAGKLKYHPLLISPANQQYLLPTKKTMARFEFQGFQWNSGIAYSYKSTITSVSRRYAISPSSVAGQLVSTSQNFYFGDPSVQIGSYEFGGVPVYRDFTTSDYCFEIVNGSFLMKHITFIPADPEISEIIGIQSIHCRLVDAL